MWDRGTYTLYSVHKIVSCKRRQKERDWLISGCGYHFDCMYSTCNQVLTKFTCTVYMYIHLTIWHFFIGTCKCL